jgi:uncharacterized protein (TIGR02246 family)
MNRKGIWVLAAILILAAGCAPKADAPKDVAAVKAMSVTYSEAATAGDASAIVSSFYADDAVRLDCNAPIRIGKDAIRSSLQSFFDQYNHQETDVAEEVHVIGDLAFARGTFSTKDSPKVPGGAVIEDKGKWVTVYRRQPGGAWKGIVDIWNSDQPVAQVLMPASADEYALLQLERDWTAAWLKQDPAALDGVLADEFVENYQGQTTTKKQMIANMKAGVNKIESSDVMDMRAVVFGDDGVVNGVSTVKGTERGKAVDRKMRWTDVYEKRDGRWRAVVSYIFEIK